MPACINKNGNGKDPLKFSSKTQVWAMLILEDRQLLMHTSLPFSIPLMLSTGKEKADTLVGSESKVHHPVRGKYHLIYPVIKNKLLIVFHAAKT